MEMCRDRAGLSGTLVRAALKESKGFDAPVCTGEREREREVKGTGIGLLSASSRETGRGRGGGEVEGDRHYSGNTGPEYTSGRWAPVAWLLRLPTRIGVLEYIPSPASFRPSRSPSRPPLNVLSLRAFSVPLLSAPISFPLLPAGLPSSLAAPFARKSKLSSTHILPLPLPILELLSALLFLVYPAFWPPRGFQIQFFFFSRDAAIYIEANIEYTFIFAVDDKFV